MSHTIERPVVCGYDSIEAFEEILEGKGTAYTGDQYWRDGSDVLTATESRIAEFARVEAGELVLFSSGMAAECTAIDVALAHGKKGERSIACAQGVYSQTEKYFHVLAEERGITVSRFDSGWDKDVTEVIKRDKPTAVYAETIGNGPTTPVLDIATILGAIKQHSPDTVLVLDNTVPTSTHLPLGEVLNAHQKVLVADSATKAVTGNAELCGYIYSKNPELLDAVRARRPLYGPVPGVGSLALINEVAPRTVEDFDERVQRASLVTGALAVHLFEAQQHGAPFLVSHPALPSHENFEYAAEHYPNGCSPVLFLQVPMGQTGKALAQQLWASPEVREQAEIGQSFCLDNTRILFSNETNYVRIAGGICSDPQTLGAALYAAALSSPSTN